MSGNSSLGRRSFFSRAAGAAVAVLTGTLVVSKKAFALPSCTGLEGNACEASTTGCFFVNGQCELFVPPSGIQFHDIVEVYEGLPVGQCCTGTPTGPPVCSTAVPDSPCD